MGCQYKANALYRILYVSNVVLYKILKVLSDTVFLLYISLIFCAMKVIRYTTPADCIPMKTMYDPWRTLFLMDEENNLVSILDHMSAEMSCLGKYSKF